MMTDSFFSIVLYLVGNSFHMYITYRFLRLFFQGNSSHQRLILPGFVLYFLINSLAFLCLHNVWVNLITSVLLLFLLTYLYDGRLRQRILATVLIYTVCMMSETLVYWVLLAVMGGNNFAVGIIAPNLLTFPFVLIAERLSSLRSGDRVSLSNWFCTVMVPVISLFLATIVLTDEKQSIRTVLAIAGILLINVALFYLVDHLAEAYQQTLHGLLLSRQMEAYQHQLQIQEKVNHRVGILHHDMKNHLYTLKSMVSEGDKETLLNYIDQLEASLDVPEQLANTGNPAMDGIVSQKLQQAKGLGVEVRTKITVPSDLPFSDLDLVAVLGNLLDNAIEALGRMEAVDERRLGLHISLEQNVLFIQVCNTCAPNEEPQPKSGGLFSTSKQETELHGIGLSSVAAAAEKYQGWLEIAYEQGSVCAEVLMHCPEEAKQ